MPEFDTVCALNPLDLHLQSPLVGSQLFTVSESAGYGHTVDTGVDGDVAATSPFTPSPSLRGRVAIEEEDMRLQSL
ncbi:hypothetical protein [Nocardia thraciensis]